MIVPGFIDLQINGFKGIDFSGKNLTVNDINQVSIELLKQGTIAYCPTIISSFLDIYKQNLPTIANARSSEKGAKILGIHIEGPFLNPENGFRGIHPKKNIIPPSINAFKKFQEWSDDNISILTIAPDQPGALKLIEYAVSHSDTIISLGHHNANRETIKKAVDLGAKAATHVGNGLNKMIHRFNNPLWPILGEDRLYGFFITDGFHIPDDMIKTCIRAKSVSKFIVTSDLVHLARMIPGRYVFKDANVVLESSGYLHREGSSQLAGSTSTMMECMNHLASIGELDKEGLKKVGYENQLNLIGKDLDQKFIEKLPGISFENNQFISKK